jgi:DNA (cytosine-5)-methyltransferase 1
VDLFSGVGGLSLGLELAGFFSAMHVEVEEQASRYANFNFPLARHYGGAKDGDVRALSGELINSVVGGREVAVIAGGPPCQGFSTAGRRRVDDPLNDLVLEMARVVDEVRPRAFLIENVPGSLSSQYWQFHKAVEMLSSSYSVSPSTVLAAEDFGVPQKRRRVFTVGVRKDVGRTATLPSASHLARRDGDLDLGLPTTPTVAEALMDLPNCDDFEELFDRDWAPYGMGPHSDFAHSMRDPRGLARERGYEVDWDGEICTNLRRTNHGPKLRTALSMLRPGEKDPSSRIPRLDPDGLSVTIRAGTTADRGSWSAPRPCHPVYPRVLTTRECARIQSFPDWFRFHPVKWHGNRQVGNAVPPLLARAVGAHLLRLLDLAPSSSHDSVVVRRDRDLIADDLASSEQSRLGKRQTSHQVVNTGARSRGGLS